MELYLTVLLNLKCEELKEIGTPIMAQTKVIFKFRDSLCNNNDYF